MSSPQYYAPQNPDVIDTVRYTQRVVDQILRNNPLTDAVVGRGLMRWIGNYTNSGDPEKINFLWIGEFNPADTNLPGNPPQRGISLVRDDSRGGESAFTMYDPSPGAGGGLKQTLHVRSGDAARLWDEAREGGQLWPEVNIPMWGVGSTTADWFGVTDNSPTWGRIFEGRVNIVGHSVEYTFYTAGTAGCAAEYRVRVQGSDGDHVSATHAIGAGGAATFSGSVDVTTVRGNTHFIFLEGRRTNGVGVARATIHSMRCYTP